MGPSGTESRGSPHSSGPCPLDAAWDLTQTRRALSLQSWEGVLEEAGLRVEQNERLGWGKRWQVFGDRWRGREAAGPEQRTHRVAGWLNKAGERVRQPPGTPLWVGPQSWWGQHRGLAPGPPSAQPDLAPCPCPASPAWKAPCHSISEVIGAGQACACQIASCGAAGFYRL